MARKRKSKAARKQQLEKEIKFGVTLVLAIVLAIVVYGEKGKLHTFLSPILGGIFGPVKYLIPIGVFLLALVFAGDKKEENSFKAYSFLGMIISISSIIMIYQISKMGLRTDQEFKIILEECYNLGAGGQGGGAIGAIIAIPAIRLLGTTGASIALFLIGAILGFITFDISPTEYASDLVENLNEKREERKVARLKRYEQRQKERQEEIEQAEKEIKLNFTTNSGNMDKMRKKHDEEKKEQEEKEKFNIFGLFKKKEKPEYEENKVKIRGLKVNNRRANTKEEIKTNNVSSINGRDINTETGEIIEEADAKKIEDNFFKEVAPVKEEQKHAVLDINEDELMNFDFEYDFPPMDLLKPSPPNAKVSASAIEQTAMKLQKTLMSFGVSAKVENASVGPTITRYELKPAVGVRVSRIANLADDIALNLAAETIRIEAPIPGKQAVGIEVPNKEQGVVSFRDVVESEKFQNHKSPIAFALGEGVGGEPVIADLDKMRHLMIAGATGSGKSVCINTIINSIIYHAKPQDVQMIMIDPKVVELSGYNNIPHLFIPVVTEVQNAAAALKWCVGQMTKRYNKFAEFGAKDIDSFNRAVKRQQDRGEKPVPRLVIIVDELADLMMAAPKDVEDSICRIAQMGRAAGIHLIIATQRPSVDVITGLIKANIPSRIAFSVTSGVDSRTILDQVGAEKLLGKGDMLYYPMGATKPIRVQGAFLTDEEIAEVVEYIKLDKMPEHSRIIQEKIEGSLEPEEADTKNETGEEVDELLIDAIDTMMEFKQASKTFLRRKFAIGDIRAGRIIDKIEEMGIIGPQDGTKPREILISDFTWDSMKAKLTGEVPPEKEPEPGRLAGENTFFDQGREIQKRPIAQHQENDDVAKTLVMQSHDLQEPSYEEYETIDPLLRPAVEVLMSSENISPDILRQALDINNVRAEKLFNQMSDIGIIVDDGNQGILNITSAEWDIMKNNL